MLKTNNPTKCKDAGKKDTSGENKTGKKKTMLPAPPPLKPPPAANNTVIISSATKIIKPITNFFVILKNEFVDICSN